MSDKLSHFHEKFLEALQEIYKENNFPNFFENALKEANGTIYQKNITETKTFDEEWISTVESYFPSLNKIISNPKSALRYDEDVVPIEKAKKITSASIRHLSSNTKYIREVTEEDEVIPNKLLTSLPEIEYQTYENRMIMTLIDRLFQFVRKRLDIIEIEVESFQKKHLNLQTVIPLQKTEVSLKIDVVIKEDLDDEKINEYNLKLLERVRHLSKLVTSLKGGEFAENMKNYKRVHAPIMKTSIILKNTDYRNAYMLWLFLDRYNTLTFDLEVLEKDLTFDDHYLSDLYKMALVTYSTVQVNQEKRKVYYKELETRKTTKKGLEVTYQDPNDMILDPKEIEIEDNAINEYYLNQNKKLFEKSLEYHEKTSKTYETSLKRALRDTIEFSNALYKSFFELEEDEDIFRKLVKDKDSSEALAKAKKQALIAKMIREVKEVDYNNAVRLEKKLYQQIQKLDQKLIDEKNKRVLTTAKKIKSEAKLKREKLEVKQAEKMLALKAEMVRKNKEDLTLARKTAEGEISDLQLRLETEARVELKAYEESLRKEREVLQKAYLKEQRELEKTYQLYMKEQTAKVVTKQKEVTSSMKERYQSKIEKEKRELEREYHKKINVPVSDLEEVKVIKTEPKKVKPLVAASIDPKKKPRRVERKVTEQGKQLLAVYKEKLK